MPVKNPFKDTPRHGSTRDTIPLVYHEYRAHGAKSWRLFGLSGPGRSAGAGGKSITCTGICRKLCFADTLCSHVGESCTCGEGAYLAGGELDDLATFVSRQEDWMKSAACKKENFPPEGAWWDVFDPNIFFPERGRLDDVDKARWTCFVCPVSRDCDEYRNRSGSDYGIWAGKFKEKDKPESAEPMPLEVTVDILHLEI